MTDKIKSLIISTLLCAIGINAFIEEAPQIAGDVLVNMQYLFDSESYNISTGHIQARRINEHGVSLKCNSDILAIISDDKYHSTIEKQIIDSHIENYETVLIGEIDPFVHKTQESVHLVFGSKNGNANILKELNRVNNTEEITIQSKSNYYRSVYASVIIFTMSVSLLTYIVTTLKATVLIYNKKKKKKQAMVSGK